MFLGRIFAVALIFAGVTALAVESEEPEARDNWDVLWTRAVERLSDRDVTLRRLAAVDLEKLVKSPGFSQFVQSSGGSSDIREGMTKIAAIAGRKDEDIAVRIDLVRIVAIFPSRPLSRAAAFSLIPVLEDESQDYSIRCAIIQWLAPRGPSSLFKNVAMRDSTGSKSPDVREAWFGVLDRLGLDSEVELVLAEKGLDDPVAAVRREAIGMAGNLATEGDSSARAVLRRALKRADPLIHRGALNGIVRLGPEVSEFLPDLVEALKYADAAFGVALARTLLDVTGDVNAYAPVLIDGVSSPDLSIRYQATAGLIAFRDRDPNALARLPEMQSLLKHSDPRIRDRAATIFRRASNDAGRSPVTRERGGRRTGRRRNTWVSRQLFWLGLPRVALSRETEELLTHVAMIAIGLTGLVVYVWADVRHWSRREAQARASLSVLKLPRRIHLRRADGQPWKFEDDVRRWVDTLLGMGFEDVGPFQIAEVPAARLWALVRPEDAVAALVCEHRVQGRYLKLTTEYLDGTSFTINTQASGFRPAQRPGRVTVYVQEDELTTLYRRHLAERPDRPLRPITAARFVAEYEQSHADYVDWKNSLGGMTPEEIREFNRLQGVEADDEQIAALRTSLQRRALDELDRSLRERFLERRMDLSAEERRRISERLVIIHDGLPLVSTDDLVPPSVVGSQGSARGQAASDLPSSTPLHQGPSPRLAFSARNQRLDGLCRYTKVGELSEPVAADFYLAPAG